MTKKFEAKAVGDEMRVSVYGPIGGYGVRAQDFKYALQDAKRMGVGKVTVCINSPGGDAFEGMAIRAQLASWEGDTRAEVEGVAASAASVIAMGCKTIAMHLGSAMMIHEAALIATDPMSAADLEKAQNTIATLNDGLASVYAKRTGKTKAAILKLMAAETWLTPDQAVSEGFANEVIDTEVTEAMKVAASFDFKLFGYQHVPDKFKASDANGGGKDVDEPEGEDGEDPVDDATDPDIKVPPPDVDPRQLPLLPPKPENVPQPSAASNAEASDRRKRLDTMTIKLIASAMGLADADESAVVAAVSQQHQFVAELKSLLKSASLDAALGAIRGLQAAAEQVPVLTAKLAEQAQSMEAQERAAILAADKANPEGRRVTPTAEAWLATQSLDVLKGYIANTAPVLKVENAANGGAGQQQPAAKSGANSESNTGSEVLTHNGVAFENMSGSARAELFHSDKERYEALQRNHAERGSPRAQSQQQRASA